MIKAVLVTFLIVFACLGLCDCIHAVISVFLMPDVRTSRHCVVFLKPGCATEQLRWLSGELRWYGTEFCDDVIGVVDKLSDVEISACESFCYKNQVFLCRLDNLENQFNFLETGEINGE